MGYSRIVFAALALAHAAAAPASAGTTERVSVGPGGAQANNGSASASISADGRFVAFVSAASNLVPGDTNGSSDVFVRDRRPGAPSGSASGPGGAQAERRELPLRRSRPGRRASSPSTSRPATWCRATPTMRPTCSSATGGPGTTERVSVGAGGAQGDGSSFFPAISAGGRFVAFSSEASNLVPGDTNGARDVFVRDRQPGATERVSVGAGGAQGNDEQRRSRRSRRTGGSSPSARCATQPGAGRHQRRPRRVRPRPAGRHDRAGQRGHGRCPGQRRRASTRRSRWAGASSRSVPAPATWSRATPTGRDVFVRDRRTGRDRAGQRGHGRRPGQRRQLRPGGLGGRALRRLRLRRHQPGAGRHQRSRGRLRPRPADRATERVSLGPGGAQGNDVQLRPGDLGGRALRRFPLRCRATWCRATPTGAEDVFVRDRRAGTTERISVGNGGRQANDGSGSRMLSAGGRFVAFASDAANLVPGDTNGEPTFSSATCGPGVPSGSASARAACKATATSFAPALSADGRFVAFSSLADNLVPGDTNAALTCSSAPAEPSQRSARGRATMRCSSFPGPTPWPGTAPWSRPGCLPRPQPP